jgi:hypothetical protein
MLSPGSPSGFDPSLYNSRPSYADYSRYSVGSNLAQLTGTDIADPELGYWDPRASSWSMDKDSVRQSMIKKAQNEALFWNEKNAEPDDYLHEPGPFDLPKKAGARPTFWTPDRICVGGMSGRGLLNVVSLLVLCTGLIGLFLGYPVGYCACASLPGTFILHC